MVVLECLGSWWWRVEENVSGGSDGKNKNPQDTALVLFVFLMEPIPSRASASSSANSDLNHASRFKSNGLKDICSLE